MKKQNPQSSSEPGGRLSALRERLRPFFVPAVGVLAVCAAVLSFIFLWPRPQNEEEAAALPGAGGEPAQQEDAPQAAQTGSETPEHEESIPHRFWETVPEMSLEEAISIGKEKTLRLDDPLTDRERMAIYTWVSQSFYYWRENERAVITKGFGDGREGSGTLEEYINRQYKPSDSSYFYLAVWTRPDYSGEHIFEAYPWRSREYGAYTLQPICQEGVDGEQHPVKGSSPAAEANPGRLSLPDRFPTESFKLGNRRSWYGEGIKFSSAGRIDSINFNFVKDGILQSPMEIPQELFNEVLRHYLSLDSVSWVSLNHVVFLPVD